jgi:hypothetical protein
MFNLEDEKEWFWEPEDEKEWLPEPFRTSQRLEKMYHQCAFLDEKYHLRKEGQKVLLSEMTDQHLKNMISLILREIDASKNGIKTRLLKRKLAVYAIEYTARNINVPNAKLLPTKIRPPLVLDDC